MEIFNLLIHFSHQNYKKFPKVPTRSICSKHNSDEIMFSVPKD